MLAYDAFVMNCAKMSYTELITWLLDAATLQEAHHFHGTNWPDFIPGAKKFREHAEILTITVKAAENMDRLQVKAREQAHADALLSINMNANYIVMRSHHEKDVSLLHNVGYVVKEKTKKGSKPTSISSRPLIARVKNGPGTRTVTVMYTRDPVAGLYQLQICKGEPTGEDSWGEYGSNKGCRVIIDNLELANWYYFRVRSCGNNETSPWSAPVGIIVV